MVEDLEMIAISVGFFASRGCTSRRAHAYRRDVMSFDYVDCFPSRCNHQLSQPFNTTTK